MKEGTDRMWDETNQKHPTIYSGGSLLIRIPILSEAERRKEILVANPRMFKHREGVRTA
jgi:hypothetical protein